MKHEEISGRKTRAGAVDRTEILPVSEASATGLDQQETSAREERKKILRRRAKEMAAGSRETGMEEDTIEVVEFLVAQERYAVELSFVREVCALKEFTPLPGTPPFVLGVISLHGRILSVLDIKKLFELPEKGLTELNKVLVLHDNDMEFGILADSLGGVRRFAPSELQTSLPTLIGIRSEYLLGLSQERVIILDAGKLLRDKSIIVHESVGA